MLGSALEAIGNTPLVELARLTRGVEGRIAAKLEFLNPGYSKKDRIAKEIVLEAERAGELAPGQPVVELTSGNTGTGLAIVCALTGHPFVAVMSRGNSVERARMMAALGARTVLVEQAAGSVPGEVSGEDLKLVEQEAQRLTRELGAFRADQFHHRGNFLAHYRHTAREILEQTGGSLTAFCDFAGTAGSFSGCAARFKEANPKIRCYLVEPVGAAALAGEAVTMPGHRIQGGGYSMPELELLNRAQVDGYLQVSDAEAMETTRRMAREEGLFAGFSSGANVAAALQLLAGPERGGTVAVLLCDSGLKYLSTDLWK
jgi:cysteine synthase A